VSAPHRGSCLCGSVRYEVDAPLTQIVMCHCGMCRKATGTAFATNAPVPKEKFRVVAGAELLKEFESSPGKHRVFCGRCGSPIVSKGGKTPDIVRVRIGTLDTPVGRRPDFHFMAEFKADWDEINDGLPRYPGFEPGRR
jgi:hypothetical protein